MRFTVKQMKETVAILNVASDEYYNNDNEIMSNKEYDDLYDRLVVMEKELGITLSNSPTQTVGYEVKSKLEKVKHEKPAKSLDKTKSVNELSTFLKGKVGMLSWKLDGLTVVATYENGELVQAVTRGNGEIGEDITANARTFKNLPTKISFPYKLVVRGEAVISYKNFEKINAELPDEEKYKNPRNLVSGSVRQLDSSVCAKRNVEFIAFNIENQEKLSAVVTKEDEYLILELQGFEVVGHKEVTKETMEEVVEFFTELGKDYKYPIDGLVLTHDDIAYGRSLGETSKYPLHSIAFKWADAEKETKLINVEWQTSRTGLINPVAVFEPVELEGTTVERASVHNVDIFEDLELGIGDTITVYKANLIIPQVAENLTRSGCMGHPVECPVCGGGTEVRMGKTARNLYCTNDLCGAKIIKRLAHFVARNGMNIEGLSEATIEKFVDAGLLNTAVDIYRLNEHKAVICKMEGMGLKSYIKLMDAIEKSRKVSMAYFINSLGIPHIGLSTARALAKWSGNDLDKISRATVSTLTMIDGIGTIVAKSIYDYFADENNYDMAYALMEQVNFIEEHNSEVENTAIMGKTFVITGDVNIFKNRKELQMKIEFLGGKVTGSVSKKTDYLINNDNKSTTGKNKKAKECGTKIITEQEFIELLG